MFGIVDTNSDPSLIDYVIPANDDATKSIDVILSAMVEAMKEGLEERKIEKADAEAAAEQTTEVKERKTRVRKSRTQKEDDEAMNARVAEKYASKDSEE